MLIKYLFDPLMPFIAPILNKIPASKIVGKKLKDLQSGPLTIMIRAWAITI